MASDALLRIGSRASRLALVQAEQVKRALEDAHPELGEVGALKIVPIETSGDKRPDVPLYEIGGKGLFTKELEEALLDGRIDLAVHSAKDMESWLPPGLLLAATLPREDPRDVLIAASARSLGELPRGARVGTSSPRRAAQLLLARPDLVIVPLRGNVETRLRKLAEGAADATLLARAGLSRLGFLERAGGAVLPVEAMLPAAGQGTIAIECRADDGRTRQYLEPINDGEAWSELTCERALLAALGGSCRTPIAALARHPGEGRLALDALLVKPDGSDARRTRRIGAPEDAALMGADAGLALREAAGPAFFETEA